MLITLWALCAIHALLITLWAVEPTLISAYTSPVQYYNNVVQALVSVGSTAHNVISKACVGWIP